MAKPVRSTVQGAERHIYKRQPFNAGTLTGGFNEHGQFVVKSYGMKIAIYTPGAEGWWLVSRDECPTVTTKRHLTLASRNVW